jgi:hypothetical protein
MHFRKPLFIISSLFVATVVVMCLVGATAAMANVPAFAVESYSIPTNLPPGGEGEVILKIVNLGDTEAMGETSPIVVTDKLPPGMTATAVEARPRSWSCEEPPALRCELLSKLNLYKETKIGIKVKVAEHPPSPEINEMRVSGGGAASVVSRHAMTVNEASANFGVEAFNLMAMNEDGSIDTQAGSHPFQLTTTFEVTNGFGYRFSDLGDGTVEPPALMKDLHFDLPAGLIGNAQAIPQCTSQQFDEFLPGPSGTNACPDDTAIGVAVVLARAIGLSSSGGAVPLFNLAPSVGEPARFGFVFFHVPIILDTAVRTGGSYGVVVNVNNVSNTLTFFGSQVTFWGVPGDSRHDAVRGWKCLEYARNNVGECTPPTSHRAIPFLTLPTSCAGPAGMRTTMEADAWEKPGSVTAESLLQEGAGEPLGLVGCNTLPFEPSVTVAPDVQAGSTPTGLSVGVHVSQAGALNSTGLAPSDVRNTTVVLPVGVQISPAGADGLEACSLAQIGLEERGDPSCPDGSKIATAEVKTPLLPNPLVGAVYLAAQNANPFGSLVAMYIVVKDPVSGVLIKLAGQVKLDPVTGQLVSTFENTPQLPFEDLTLHFFGSARAPLTTPALCGTYTTTSLFTPWSGNEPATPSSSFQITSGPNGSPCSEPLPFDPGFQAGSTNLQAGAFTPFTLTMSRPDGDQTLSGIEMQMPPGLLGTLSNVKLCAEPQASEGSCGEESLIGHTVVSVGLGNDPYTVTGGKVFVTTGYKGAPYGLSIVNPAKAGPFDLGTVVVRASISVDPHTAALTIKSDPLPTILDGIPLQIQHVNVTVDRDKFTFNPTDCDKMKINGTLSSTEGATVPVSTSFQVTNCATLAFKPKLTVSTSGKVSRANGASLHVKLTYPGGPYDANIAKVKVSLPKQLPSNLPALQRACPSSTFNTNPAGCDPESRIGTASATTPVLPVPLTGPVYFVSHGGAKFPELVIVLSGYGTTVQLDAETFISKTGITSSTFRAIPDVPVGTFELTLPQGKYSALAAPGGLCGKKLAMPTSFVAQNGMEIHQSTPIGVTGCQKHKKAKKARKTGANPNHHK